MNSIKLAILGDLHYGVDDMCRPGSEVGGLMEKYVDILNDKIRPDAILNMGDHINNVDHDQDQKNIQYLCGLLDERVHMPVFHVLGNHDAVFLNKAEIAQTFKSESGWHSFVYCGFKFIVLDTVDPMVGVCGGHVGKTQMEWLRKQMNEDSIPKIVLGHHPIDDQTMRDNMIFTPDDMHLNFLENKDEVREILENGNNFIVYICGHMHWFSFLNHGKGTYITTPSFTEASPETKGAPGSYLVVDIYTNGRIEACVHTLRPERALGRFTKCE